MQQYTVDSILGCIVGGAIAKVASDTGGQRGVSLLWFHLSASVHRSWGYSDLMVANNHRMTASQYYNQRHRETLARRGLLGGLLSLFIGGIAFM
jgi:hypothetical protein